MTENEIVPNLAVRQLIESFVTNHPQYTPEPTAPMASTPEPTSQPAVNSGGDEPAQVCPLCTLLNDEPGALKCQVCGAGLGSGQPAAPSAASSAGGFEKSSGGGASWEHVWTIGCGARSGVLSIWRPVRASAAEVFFGDGALVSTTPPTEATPLVCQDDPELFQPPSGFRRIWDQQRGGAVYIWEPLPPGPDFVTLGDVATVDPSPPQAIPGLRCVRRDLVHAWFGSTGSEGGGVSQIPDAWKIWDDAGTGGADGALWRAPTQGLFLVVGPGRSAQGGGRYPPPAGLFGRFALGPGGRAANSAPPSAAQVCPLCTFLNEEPGALKCQLCGTGLGSGPPPPSAASASSSAGGPEKTSRRPWAPGSVVRALGDAGAAGRMRVLAAPGSGGRFFCFAPGQLAGTPGVAAAPGNPGGPDDLAAFRGGAWPDNIKLGEGFALRCVNERSGKQGAVCAWRAGWEDPGGGATCIGCWNPVSPGGEEGRRREKPLARADTKNKPPHMKTAS